MEHDEIAPTIQTELHIDDNLNQKTYYGGIFTMAILASIVYICIKDGIYLVTSHNPFMASVKMIIPIDDASSYLPKLQFDASELNNVVLGVFDF